VKGWLLRARRLAHHSRQGMLVVMENSDVSKGQYQLMATMEASSTRRPQARALHQGDLHQFPELAVR
jgi:hypothetical protein